MRGLVLAAACAAALMVPARPGNLDNAHNVGFHVPNDSTAVILDAVDGDNVVWGSDEFSVSTTYVEHSLDYLKSQLPLSGNYPELTLRLTVTGGQSGCGCIGHDSTVAILD